MDYMFDVSVKKGVVRFSRFFSIIWMDRRLKVDIFCVHGVFIGDRFMVRSLGFELIKTTQRFLFNRVFVKN